MYSRRRYKRYKNCCINHSFSRLKREKRRKGNVRNTRNITKSNQKKKGKKRKFLEPSPFPIFQRRNARKQPVRLPTANWHVQRLDSLEICCASAMRNSSPRSRHYSSFSISNVPLFPPPRSFSSSCSFYPLRLVFRYAWNRSIAVYPRFHFRRKRPDNGPFSAKTFPREKLEAFSPRFFAYSHRFGKSWPVLKSIKRNCIFKCNYLYELKWNFVLVQVLISLLKTEQIFFWSLLVITSILIIC